MASSSDPRKAGVDYQVIVRSNMLHHLQNQGRVGCVLSVDHCGSPFPNNVNKCAVVEGPGCLQPDTVSKVSTIGLLNENNCPAQMQVCFITSNLRGAGTDSTVSFELTGDRGTTGCITVAAGRAAFERGCRDTFCYTRPWLGHLQQLVVWHDNAGAAAGRGPWHLEAVVVSNTRDLQVRACGRLHSASCCCGRWSHVSQQLCLLLVMVGQQLCFNHCHNMVVKAAVCARFHPLARLLHFLVTVGWHLTRSSRCSLSPAIPRDSSGNSMGDTAPISS